MKPPPCQYERASSVDQALEVLASHGDQTKLLAGGQSLVPLMNMRLSRPERLLDIQALDELKYRRADNGFLRLGALTTQAQLERDREVADTCPLLAEAVPYVGHVAIRNRGTVGGTIAHADPAAELPVVLLALGGSVTLRKRGGERTVAAEDFFKSFLMTEAETGELLTEVAFPTTAPSTGTAFEEFARRPGDFALVSVACVVERDGESVSSARIALGGVSSKPLLLGGLEALEGTSTDEAAATAAELAREAVDPPPDIHGTADYRRHLTGELVRRAVSRAMTDGGGS